MREGSRNWSGGASGKSQEDRRKKGVTSSTENGFTLEGLLKARQYIRIEKKLGQKTYIHSVCKGNTCAQGEVEKPDDEGSPLKRVEEESGNEKRIIISAE